DGRTRQASLFLTPRNARLESAEGKVLSANDADVVRQLTGVASVASTRELAGEGLSKRIGASEVAIYTPFAPGERNAECRGELRAAHSSVAADPWAGRLSR